MKSRRVGQCILISVIALSVTMTSQGWAWGTKGHTTIETVAVSILPDSPLSHLLKNNINSVRFLAMTPDLQWKHGPHAQPLEGQAHFFQMEYYSPHGEPLNPDINFYLQKSGGLPALLKQGTAPWRMEQMAQLLIKVLRKPQVGPVEVVQVAATLGHYVGDLGNPLHVDADYDGAGIGQTGLHSFFESLSVNAYPDQELFPAVTNAANIMAARLPNIIPPISVAFNLARAASRQAPDVLDNAKALGQTQDLQSRFRPIIVTTLAMSSAMLAKLWNEAYVVAGSPQLDTHNFGRVAVPDWVPVSYLPAIPLNH